MGRSAFPEVGRISKACEDLKDDFQKESKAHKASLSRTRWENATWANVAGDSNSRRVSEGIGSNQE